MIDSLESRAVWRADLPEAGEYAVYVSYEQTPNSVDDAHYTVYHAGGETRFSVNQNDGRWHMDSSREVPLQCRRTRGGRIVQSSRQAGRTVSADAVKIGGGFGNIIRSTSDSLRLRDTVYIEETSGYPRFCRVLAIGFNGQDSTNRSMRQKQHWTTTKRTTCREPIGSMH